MDDITILRNGVVTGHLNTGETTEEEIARMMVGKKMSLTVDKQENKAGEVRLEINCITRHDRFVVKTLDQVSFTVRSGEIVGIAGVQGNGQTDLIDVITGFEEGRSRGIDKLAETEEKDRRGIQGIRSQIWQG